MCRRLSRRGGVLASGKPLLSLHDSLHQALYRGAGVECAFTYLLQPFGEGYAFEVKAVIECHFAYLLDVLGDIYFLKRVAGIEDIREHDLYRVKRTDRSQSPLNTQFACDMKLTGRAECAVLQPFVLAL